MYCKRSLSIATKIDPREEFVVQYIQLQGKAAMLYMGCEVLDM